MNPCRPCARWLRALVLAPCVLALAACALPRVTRRPAQTQYRLLPSPQRLAEPGLRPVVLRVLPMQAAPGLDGVDMLYSEQPLQLMPYRDSRWLVPPAQMIDSALRQTLARQRWVDGVEGMLPLGRSQWTLECRLQRLEHDVYAHRVELGLACQLVDNASGRLAASWRFDSTRQPAAQDAAGYAAATQRLLDDALAQVLRRTAAALRAAQGSAAGSPASAISRSSDSP